MTAKTADVPLVMLHGSFGCGGDWREVVHLLGREAITPDLPGHGVRCAAPAASFGAAVEEIAGSLPSGCDLVGYSLGGRLALAAALRAPRGTVRSLVLESAHPGLGPTERVLRLAEDRSRGLQLRRDPEGFFRAFYGSPLFASFRQHPKFDAVVSARLARVQSFPDACASTLIALSPGHQLQLAEDLWGSGIPTLIVVGSLDKKYAEIGSGLVDGAPDGAAISCVQVGGAGHNVHFEQPDAFIGRLQNFWSPLEGTSGPSENSGMGAQP